MIHTTVDGDAKERKFISQWLGINAKTITSDGEFKDTKNCTITDFPCLESVGTERISSFSGKLKSNIITSGITQYALVLDGTMKLMVWSDKQEDRYDLNFLTSTDKRTILLNGNKLYIMPDGIEVNVDNLSTTVNYKYLSIKYTNPHSDGQEDCYICNKDGERLWYRRAKSEDSLKRLVPKGSIIINKSRRLSSTYGSSGVFQVPVLYTFDETGHPKQVGHPNRKIPNLTFNGAAQNIKLGTVSGWVYTADCKNASKTIIIWTKTKSDDGTVYVRPLFYSTVEKSVTVKAVKNGTTQSNTNDKEITFNGHTYYYGWGIGQTKENASFSDDPSIDIKFVLTDETKNVKNAVTELLKIITFSQNAIDPDEPVRYRLGVDTYNDDDDDVKYVVYTPSNDKYNYAKATLYSFGEVVDIIPSINVFTRTDEYPRFITGVCTYMLDTSVSPWQLLARSDATDSTVVMTPYLSFFNPTVSNASFEEGDSVSFKPKFTNTSLQGDYVRIDGIKNGRIIVRTDIKTAYITNTYGINFGGYVMERSVPDMDYYTIAGNRMWGCKFGKVGTDMVNSIYASKLGDFSNWYYFQDTTMDSWSVAIGDHESFTGICTFRDMPFFFKENFIYYIYGGVPSQYSRYMLEATGVAKNCSESIVSYYDRIIYKGKDGVYVTDGTSVQKISDALGSVAVFKQDESYEAFAGGDNERYLLSIGSSNTGVYSTYIYYLNYDLWRKINDHKMSFISGDNSGQLVALSDDPKYATENSFIVQNLGIDKRYGETEHIADFCADTTVMGFDSPDTKYVNRFLLRAIIDEGAALTVSIKYDSDNWQILGSFAGVGYPKTYVMDNLPQRCELYSLRFEGTGKVKIITLACEYEQGSDY